MTSSSNRKSATGWTASATATSSGWTRYAACSPRREANSAGHGLITSKGPYGNFGKAVYDQRRALGLSVTDLAGRADMTVDEIECIEEGGTEPTIALLRRLAAALDSDVRLTPGHDLGSVWFEPHAA